MFVLIFARHTLEKSFLIVLYREE